MMISLFAWSKLHNVNYSTAHKMLKKGELYGAVGSLVPEETLPPQKQTVSCMICGGKFPQITGTHLRKHNMTIQDYKNKFPDEKLISEEVISTIVDSATGRERTEEHRRNLSESLKGREAWNKGLVGVVKDSEETKAKKSASHMGLTHTEEAKIKIGDAHRGVPETEEAIANNKAAQLEYFKTHDAPFKGMNHTESAKLIMSQKAIIREASWTPEEAIAVAERRVEKIRGLKRTDEQKETYREARSKYMEDNPISVTSTAGEITIMKRLDALGITYKRQFRIPGVYQPYDFYLPDYRMIVEFDGSHHWLGRWWGIKNKNQEEIDQILVEQRFKDAYENLAAGRAAYRIIRLLGRGDVGCPEWGTMDEQLVAQGFPEMLL